MGALGILRAGPCSGYVEVNTRLNMSFIALANLAELHDGFRRQRRIGGHSLLLIQEHGQRFIIEDRCPHMDAPLANGLIAQDTITCRAHGIAFSLTTGLAQGPLAASLDCLKRYPLVYDGNQIGVDLA